MRGWSRHAIHWMACLVLVGACAPRGETPPASDVAVEFVFERFGGLCPGPEGGGAICRVRVLVLEDGTWSGAGELPGPTNGFVPAGSASRLASIIEDGWEALTSRAFTGTCPTAFDGSEVTYTVRRIPIGEGAELADAVLREVRSCTHDLSQPAARAVLSRLTEVWRDLGLPL